MPLNPDIILQASRNMPDFGKDLMFAQEVARKRRKDDAETERANKFASLQQSKPQGVSMTDWLSSQGFATEANELAKGQAETAKIQMEGNTKGMEYHAKRIENSGKILQELLTRPDLSKSVAKQLFGINAKANLIDPEMYYKAIDVLNTLPDDPNVLRQHIEGQVNALQSAKDQMQYLRPDANAQLSAQTQMRGQDITRENNLADNQYNMQKFGYDQQQDAFKNDIDQQRLTLDWQKRQDTLNQRTSGKPPTEFQGKSALYANRAQEAENILSSLDYSPAAIGVKESVSKTPLVGGMLGAAGNAMLSETNQKAEQAQRNFVNAILRQESGAVISEPEFENAKKQYFPATGDSDAVKAQKAENRRVAIESLKNNALGVIDTGIGARGASDSWQQKHGATDEEHAAVMKLLGR